MDNEKLTWTFVIDRRSKIFRRKNLMNKLQGRCGKSKRERQKIISVCVYLGNSNFIWLRVYALGMVAKFSCTKRVGEGNILLSNKV